MAYEKPTAEQLEYINDWTKENYKLFSFRLKYGRDDAIMEKMQELMDSGIGRSPLIRACLETCFNDDELLAKVIAKSR